MSVFVTLHSLPAPGSMQKHNACLPCARYADRHSDVEVLMSHHQVPGGTTSNGKMSKLAYYRHVHYTAALMCAKNRIIIFYSLLDIRKNVEQPMARAKSCML